MHLCFRQGPIEPYESAAPIALYQGQSLFSDNMETDLLNSFFKLLRLVTNSVEPSIHTATTYFPGLTSTLFTCPFIS